MLASTGLYGISLLLTRTASFLLFPVYTRFLSPADYGVLELLDLTLYAFGTLLGMRIGDALLYRWAACSSDEDRSVLLSSAYWGAVLLGLVSLGCGWMLSGLLSQLVFGTKIYAGAFILMFCAFSTSLPAEVGLALARARDRSLHYLYMSAGRLLVTASLNVFFLAALRWKYEAMLWGNLIGAVVLSAASLFYIVIQGYRWTAFRPGELRRLLAYGAPLGIGGLGMLIIHYGDRFFLRQYATLADIGIYALAYKLGMLVTNLQTPFDTYWRAQMFQIIKRPDGERIYVRVCTYLALVLMAFTVFLLAFSVPLLRVLAGREFRSAAWLVPGIGFAYVVRTIGSHFRSALLLAGAPQRDAAVVWSGAGVCLAGYALLIPRYRVWGAVLATLASFVFTLFVSLWQAQQVRWFPFEYRRMAMLLVAAAPAAVSWWLVRPQGLALQLLLGTAEFVSFFLVLHLLGFADSEEKERIAEFVRGWRGRLLSRQRAGTV
ncbi:MAG: lipopolysaccharide biosynthesis protein [Bryobacteraceae bacterium]